MWDTETSAITAGCHYRLFENGESLSFRRFVELLATDSSFDAWYSETLAAFESAAFYWEVPPLTAASLDDEAEFVLIEAPTLARIAPEPAAFAEHFDGCPGEDVVVFENLGGDATLVAPRPRGPGVAYPHLAAFLRSGESEQIRALWRVTGQQLQHRIGATPIWLNTAGDGIAWLHVRLDSRPKYYRYRPYTVSRAEA